MHLNQWRSGRQDLVALQQQAVPTNTCSNSTQDKKATASDSTLDLAVCVTTESTHIPPAPVPPPNIAPAPRPTATATGSTLPQLLYNLPPSSKMSDKIQNSNKEPGVCVETGHGRSGDPSPRPAQKQYSNGSSKKQQNRTKGNYGSSKGTLVCVDVVHRIYVYVCGLWVVYAVFTMCIMHVFHDCVYSP